MVHEDYGIGIYRGVEQITVENASKDYLKIEYAAGGTLYILPSELSALQKYAAADTEAKPKINKLGTQEWNGTKAKVRGAVAEVAEDLVKLYAARQALSGHAFAKDTVWQREFEDNFPYAETDDQIRCITEIKTDMEAPTPMDRLLCGDVGYGKTEVAFRAIMKCVMDGKQAAILVPTTVLARQHYFSAVERFSGYPVKVDMMSRFRTKNQQEDTLRKVKAGQVDLLVGTHRILQKDIRFKDLGLLVVDEEQRFGVAHKERIKQMAQGIDVLTLTATPIPRTLNMALSGIRDMSTIEEPPADRYPVQTFVMEHSNGIIDDAIRKEIMRGGQVYYLHNKVDSIERTALKIKEFLPDANIGIAHGKMSEDELFDILALTEGDEFRQKSLSRISNTLNSSKRKSEELEEIIEFFNKNDLVMVKAALEKLSR